MSEESLLEQWARDDYNTARRLARNHIDISDEPRAAPFLRDALRIMHDALGREWLERELDPTQRSGYLLLGPNTDDDVERVERNHRAVKLALALYDTRDIRGFDKLIAELRRRKLYEAVAEMSALTHMRRAGQDAWFVDPHERAGHTYDGVVVLSGIEVAVEVKAKVPQPVSSFRPRLIENSLHSARPQLPRDAPSMIYLQLASPWTNDVDVMRATNATIRRWLRSTGRVNGVHVILEKTFTRPGNGTSLSRASAFISNPAVRYPVPDLQYDDA